MFLLLKDDDDGNVERLLDEKEEESAVIALVVRTVTGATARYIVVSLLLCLLLGFFEKDLKSEDESGKERKSQKAGKVPENEKTREQRKRRDGFLQTITTSVFHFNVNNDECYYNFTFLFLSLSL